MADGVVMVPERVLAAAQAEAEALGAAGARAVLLTGSYATGTPLPHADIDLLAVGEGSHYRLSRRDGFLVATSWRTGEQVRAAFEEPTEVCTVVPGWRSAIVLNDREGIAAQLKRDAEVWTWDRIAAACDRHVAHQAWGYAEEVHKLVGALEAGLPTVAAVQRSIIALRLPLLLALHRRLLYGSENRLWDLLAEREGELWATAQGRALGAIPCTFEEGCRAGLELYLLYVEAVRPLVTGSDELAVIDGACELAAMAPGPTQQPELGQAQSPLRDF
jgi:hypothetical protein